MSDEPKIGDQKVEVLRCPDALGRYLFVHYIYCDYTPGHPEGEYVPRWRGQVYFSPLPGWYTEQEPT